MVKLQQPVWRNSMLVQAQHLQLASEYQNSINKLLLDCLGADSWGILELQYNEAALQLGLLQIESLCARLPAFQFVQYSDDCEELQLSIRLHGERVAVYLHCLCASTELVGCSKVDCYSYSMQKIPDYFADDGCSEICIRNLRIQLSCEPVLQNSVAKIKLSELERTLSGGYKFLAYFPAYLTAEKCNSILAYRKNIIHAIDRLLNVDSRCLSPTQHSLLVSHKCSLQFLNLSAHPKIFWQQFMCNYFELCDAFFVSKTANIPMQYSHDLSYELLEGVYLALLDVLGGCQVQEIILDKIEHSAGVYCINLTRWRESCGPIYLRLRSGFCDQFKVSLAKILPESSIIEAIRYSLPGLRLSKHNSYDGVIDYKVIFDETIKEIIQEEDLCFYHCGASDFLGEWDFYMQRDACG